MATFVWMIFSFSSKTSERRRSVRKCMRGEYFIVCVSGVEFSFYCLMSLSQRTGFKIHVISKIIFISIWICCCYVVSSFFFF